MKRTMLGVLFLLFLSSCHRMPIYEKEPSVKLELELDLNEGKIPAPENLKVCFFSPEGGNLNLDHYVESTGGDLSVAPGTYTLLVYSFGTEYVQIRGEGSLETIEAFTSDITASKISTYRKLTGTKAEEEAPIFYTPDHLLVAKEKITIPEFAGASEDFTLDIEASSVVQTFVFQMSNMSGLEYIESAEAFVTNQSRSYFIGRGEASTEPCILWFPVEVDREKGVLNTTFNTFGALPGGSQTYVHFIMRDTGGEEHNFSKDITKQVASPPTSETSVIEIEEEIEIPKPPGSNGISPDVDPWEQESHDVPLG